MPVQLLLQRDLPMRLGVVRIQLNRALELLHGLILFAGKQKIDAEIRLHDRIQRIELLDASMPGERLARTAAVSQRRAVPNRRFRMPRRQLQGLIECHHRAFGMHFVHQDQPLGRIRIGEIRCEFFRARHCRTRFRRGLVQTQVGILVQQHVGIGHSAPGLGKLRILGGCALEVAERTRQAFGSALIPVVAPEPVQILRRNRHCRCNGHGCGCDDQSRVHPLDQRHDDAEQLLPRGILLVDPYRRGFTTMPQNDMRAH